MDDTQEKPPRLDLAWGAHIGTYAEDMGGHVIKLTHWSWFAGDEEAVIDSIILGRDDLTKLLEWVSRDRKAEHREKMKEILKVLD